LESPIRNKKVCVKVASLSNKNLPDEAELLRRAVAGEDLAMRQLLLPHITHLSRIIADKYPRLNDGMAGVDDIVQETLIQAYRQIQQFDPEKGSLRTWLTKIADHRALNALRDARRVKRGGGHKRVGQVMVGDESSYHDLVELLSADIHTASRSAMRHEAVEAVKLAIAELPHDYQRAVQLCLIDGNTVKETAALMERTPESVQGLIDRARHKMRAALGRLSRYQ
jgi:RNA polymerase sigma-70 factor (ECF subfamily)